MEMIKVDNLHKTFKLKLKTIKALNGMSFDVKKGEILGFLGPNGAGKSTTIKIIMDLVRADSGAAFINSLKSTNPDSRLRVGFMPENPQYYDTITGMDLLKFAASMFSVKDAGKKAHKLLDEFELTEFADVKLRKYSKGMIQRIGFAAALIHDPDILILDEPMGGLDPVGRMIFKNKMKELNKSGVTIFFSSHIIPDIEDICSRVLIVKQGKTIKQFDRVDIQYLTTYGFNIILRKEDEKNLNLNENEISKGLYSIKCKKDELIEKIEAIENSSAEIVDIEPLKKSLEDIFIEILND